MLEPISEVERFWFAAQVEPLLPELYGAALRLARNETDAEDLVAEAVGRAWTHLGTLDRRSAFRGWLFRILTNCFLSDRRAGIARASSEPYGDESEEGGFSIFDRLHQPILLWLGNPEREFLNKLLREDLERAVDALPDPFRVAVVLADLQGLSYKEIAEALAVPVGTVRSRLARGRSLLQRALWTHAVDVGLRSERREEKPDV